ELGVGEEPAPAAQREGERTRDTEGDPGLGARLLRRGGGVAPLLRRAGVLRRGRLTLRRAVPGGRRRLRAALAGRTVPRRGRRLAARLVGLRTLRWRAHGGMSPLSISAAVT